MYHFSRGLFHPPKGETPSVLNFFHRVQYSVAPISRNGSKQQNAINCLQLCTLLFYVCTMVRESYYERMFTFWNRWITIVQNKHFAFVGNAIIQYFQQLVWICKSISDACDLLESELHQVEGRRPQCEIRYMINATYAAVLKQTTKPNRIPLTSEMKKSSKRYPLMTITSAATVHATLCNKNQLDELE